MKKLVYAILIVANSSNIVNLNREGGLVELELVFFPAPCQRIVCKYYSTVCNANVKLRIDILDPGYTIAL